MSHTGERETVYNLRVADWHTYFVGCDEWGFAAWAHNLYNIALGTDEGLPAFAIKYDAKYYKDWTRGMFGVLDSTPWEPTIIDGGVQSPFAQAFGTAVSNSGKIYFKLTGFELAGWATRCLAAGKSFPIGSATAWELYKLVFDTSCQDRHASEIFVNGSSQMNYDDFKIYAIKYLEAIAKQNKLSQPDWDTVQPRPDAIKTLMLLFNYTKQMIVNL